MEYPGYVHVHLQDDLDIINKKHTKQSGILDKNVDMKNHVLNLCMVFC